ncbi:amphi-Trp domain-containing protein [Natronocalculus amylovorans]|uniref:Amphi-Trp domain-containing protein n=1 Tax=Natronocalculus amylovorans TaxID=2917812 RepID=A0AAE3FW36_9EURY|nr:amphi-Trp domain-containing protein [Natronocalculus amylovorans]MCL9816225.1 amphi-Trp domain-containing protein [Natronocalculus amylovorans]NUE03322.1 amphi-Trp domain-containing protein [Halorubraceae archaeon YAN]
MPEEVLFKSESKHSRAEIAAYFQDIATKLEAGDPVTLSAGSDSITLEVPANPTFEVKAERETSKGGSNPELSIEFELEWKEGDETGEDSSLSIE